MTRARNKLLDSAQTSHYFHILAMVEEKSPPLLKQGSHRFARRVLVTRKKKRKKALMPRESARAAADITL